MFVAVCSVLETMPLMFSLVQNTWNSVSASFVVPNVTVPADGTSDIYVASVWVGIDGWSCQTAILQAGVNAVYYEGNYTWYGTCVFFSCVSSKY
jgi:hypothetical protein